jgi:hypothetical protein
MACNAAARLPAGNTQAFAATRKRVKPMRRATLWPYAVIIVVGTPVGKIFEKHLTSADTDGTLLKWLLLPAALVLVGFFFYALSVLRRNQKIAEASPEQQRAALKFQPASGKAVLYVFRHQLKGALQGHDLVLDGRCLGQIRGCTFYRLELEPGKHRLSGDKKCQESLEVEVAAGQVHFVEQELLLGMWCTGYHYLPRENAMKTRREVQECKMLLPEEEAG